MNDLVMYLALSTGVFSSCYILAVPCVRAWRNRTNRKKELTVESLFASLFESEAKSWAVLGQVRAQLSAGNRFVGIEFLIEQLNQLLPPDKQWKRS